MTRHAWPLAIAAVAAFAVAGVAYNAAQLGASLPSWTFPFLAGAACSAFVSFRAGQYARGYAHARGIRKSHFAAIRGGHR